MAVLLVQPRLVNDAFGDAGLYLDFRFGKRALLFDIGDLSSLSSREVARVAHVFVSHMHMDHFAGFDRLLRLCLYRDTRVNLIGPPGLRDAVESKLRAYTWNLLDADSGDFSLSVSDWEERGGRISASLFRARRGFEREDVPPTVTDGNRVLEDGEFHVEAVTLDHGIPSLAFAFQERLRVNVLRSRLDEMGLPVGPWLTEAKRAVRRGDLSIEFSPTPDRRVSLRDLLDSGALRTGTGQRIVYATDLAYSEANIERVIELSRDADRLFIEAGFLEEDRQIAASKKHLTAAQAGSIARRAGVADAVPMHFSPRYAHREEDLRAEFARALARS